MVQSVNRALDILEAFLDGTESMGITEIADLLGISKAATHALVNTLARKNFLQQDNTSRRYQLGFKLLQLGVMFINQSELGRAASRWAVNLCEQWGEAVNIAILAGDSALIMHRYEPKEPFLLYPQPGFTMPLYSTAAGKILLAYSPEEIREGYLRQAPFPQRTPHTICKKRELARELKVVREKGYADDREETIIGVACVGAPIRDKSGRVVAAISLSGSKSRMEERGWEEIIRQVKTTSMQISSALGYRMDM